MAATQRQARRFYAAFYRWDRVLQATRPRCAFLAHSHGAKSFTTTSAARGSADEGARQLADVLPIQKDDSELLRQLQGAAQDNGESIVEADVVPSQESIYGFLANEDDTLQNTVRNLMRNVPYPVVILTAAALDDAGESLPLGIAVSSFNTVTLNPPTVSFNIRSPSRTLDAIRADDGRFRIHFLSGEASSAQIAHSFTQGNNQETYQKRRELFEISHISGRSYNSTSIKHSQVFASLACNLVQEIPVADHVIAVAKVTDTAISETNKSVLTYAQGKYNGKKGVIKLDTDAVVKHPRLTTPEKMAHTFVLALLDSAPLIPTEESREAIKTMFIKYFTERKKNHTRKEELRGGLFRSSRAMQVRQAYFGLRTGPLIDEIAPPTAGQKATEPLRDLPVMMDFYGRLTPNDITSLIERTKEYVRRSPLFLDVMVYDLLNLLNVSPFASNYTATEIMNALRGEGLVPPFEDDYQIDASSSRIRDMEQAEHELREHLRSQRANAETLWMDGSLPPIPGLDTADDFGFVRRWLHRVYAQIHVEVFPEFHAESFYDLAGHLSRTETRLAAFRIIKYVDTHPEVLSDPIKTQTAPANPISLQFSQVLRQCRIHPLVSGFDPIFLLARLKYWHRTCTPEEYLAYRRKLMGLGKKRKLTIDGLKYSIDRLVRNAPYHVATLLKDRTDLMHVLGHDENTAILTSHGYKQMGMSRIKILIKHAMETQYANFNEKERKAVDQWMEEYKDDGPIITKWTHTTPAIKKYGVDPATERKWQEEAEAGFSRPDLGYVTELDKNVQPRVLRRRVWWWNQA